MILEDLREYCLSKRAATEGLPFGPDVIVFKVMGKMFALVPIDHENLRISLKNTPDKNQELRGEYEGIIGAYHMNKKHWNTLHVNQRIPSKLILELIDESYHIVVQKLPKKLSSHLLS